MIQEMSQESQVFDRSWRFLQIFLLFVCLFFKSFHWVKRGSTLTFHTGNTSLHRGTVLVFKYTFSCFYFGVTVALQYKNMTFICFLMKKSSIKTHNFPLNMVFHLFFIATHKFWKKNQFPRKFWLLLMAETMVNIVKSRTLPPSVGVIIREPSFMLYVV